MHMTVTNPPDTSLARLRALHNFLRAHMFYPVCLCTLLGFSFWITRALLTHQLQFRFLIFNLFLAWIPYALSLAAVRLHDQRAAERDRALIAVVWLARLAMFPNAPYIITDFVHLWDGPTFSWWFDVGLITTFALAGCFCGIASLRIMHDIVRTRIGPTLIGAVGGWLFVATVATLAGFGIYIGRFLRWNSWDILARPHRLFPQLADRLLNPMHHPRTVGVTLMFGAMVLVMYVMFASTTPQPLRRDQ
jgi:uncharacterized membrane protein